MATYLNDLRLTELATGEGSGTWGTTTNLSLELIGEALGFATQQVFGSDADATTTIADGASDPARAMYFKITSAGSLTATRTCTIAPNTISRVMFIENATTGSQSIQISQGSGASVTILAGKTAVVYLDGAGSGAAVVDAMAGVDPGVTDTLAEVLAAGNTSGANNLIIDNGQAITTNTINETTAASGVTIDSVLLKDDGVNATNLEITNLKANDGTSAGSIADSTGVVTLASSVLTTADINGGTIDGTTLGATTPASVAATTGTFSGAVTATGTSVFASLDISGDIDVDGTANLDVVDIDGAVDFASTTAHAGNATFADNAKAIFGAGSDLEIYHDGTNNRLTFASANTYIQTDGTIHFTDIGNSEKHFTINDNGAVDLYYDNVKKLATTATGIDVTGTVTADGVSVTADSITANAQDGMTLEFTGGNGVISADRTGGNYAGMQLKTTDGVAPRTRINMDYNGDVSFYEPTGTTAKFFWDASAEDLQIGSNLLNLSGVSSGTTGARINANGGGMLRLASGGVDALYVVDGGNVGIGLSSPTDYGATVNTLEVKGASASGSGLVKVTGADGVVSGALYAGGSTSMVLSTQTNHALSFATNNTERMTLSAAGALTTTGAATFGGNVNSASLQVTGNDISASLGSAFEAFVAADVVYTGALDRLSGDYREQRQSASSYSWYTGVTTGGGTSLKMTLDASGNVGIGVVPEAWTAGYRALEVGGFSLLNTNGDFSSTFIQSNAYYNGSWKYKTTGLASQFVQTSGFSTWSRAVSGAADAALTWIEDMRLDVNGNFLVGHTAQVLSSKVLSQFSGATHNGIIINETADTASTTFAAFSLSGTAIGSITRVGATSAVAYNTTSDERLKSNIANSDPVLEKIMQVQVRQYDWTEGNLHQDYGFIAQELAPVLSGIVTEGKEEADMWQLDYSRLTPALLKAIQEQQAIIESLTARIEALEGAK
jgi:hypothetical protein